MGAGTHAVDGPLSVAMLVADGDAEAAVVGSDEVDDVARVAVHVERRALARVRRPVPRPLCGAKRKGWLALACDCGCLCVDGVYFTGKSIYSGACFIVLLL